MNRQELKPKDLQLGNFIECFGKVEMVMGLIPQEGGNWFICHNAVNQGDNPINEGILFSSYGVPLTDNWKLCLGIDKYGFPEWVEFVHQAQNYIRWYANTDLLETMNWDLFKKYELNIIDAI